MKKIITTAVLAVFCAAGSNADLINVTANTADQQLSGDGTLTWVGQTTSRLGFDSVTKKSDVIIIPFALPVLPEGESILSASFSINVTLSQSIFGGEPNWNVDLYGIRAGSTPAAVWASDFYDGPDDPAHTKLTDNFIQVIGNTATPTGTYTSSSDSIAEWLQTFYTGNTPNQTYVFFRVNPDVAFLSYTNASGTQVASRFLTVATADNATAALRPVLSLTTGVIPEPATVGMLGLGALITLLIRRFRSR